MSLPLTSPSARRSPTQRSRPTPSARVSRSYPELELPLPPHLAALLPLVFIQRDPHLRIVAADLHSPTLCASLPRHTGPAISRHLRWYMERMLDGSVDFAWLSGLELHWRPHLLPVFTPSAQRRLRAMGLLDTSTTLSPIDLVGKTITNVHDLTALLGMLTPGPTPTHASATLDLDLQADIPTDRKRLTSRPFPLEAREKWRPDPLTPVTFVFSDQISIHHTDGRFAWLVHLLATNAPAALIPPGAPIVQFTDISDRFGNPALASVAHALRDAVQSAAAMTVQDEISDIAFRISRATRNRSRTTSQITLRYGCDGTTRSLDDVAELFKITRQSIFRQISIARSLCSKSDFAPALRRLAAALDENAGRPVEAVERALRPLLGPNQSLLGALQFAKDFFGISPSTPLYSARTAGSTALRKYVGKAAAHRNVGLVDALRERFVATGLCYTVDALAAVDPSSTTASSTGALLDAVNADPTIAWLGPDRRWLVWLHLDSPLVRALLQIAHTAHPYPVPISAAADGLRACLDRVQAGPQPPIQLLRASVALLAPAAGLTLQPDAIVLHDQANPRGHLTRWQLPIYECLVTLGGFASPEALCRTVPTLAGLSGQDLADRLESLSFVQSAPPGYLLRGWPHPSADAIVDAPASDRRPYRVDGSVVHCYLTNSASQRVKPAGRLVYLPTPLPDLIEGPFKHAESLWPDINVKNGRVHRLSPVATALGVHAGGRFHLEIDLVKRHYRVLLGTQ